MFGSSNNQDTNDNNQANPALPTNGFPPNDGSANPALPSEPTASPVGGATTAPHVEEIQPTVNNDKLVDDGGRAADLPMPSGSGDNSDLMSIKQQALSQLSPIVGHLDQSPEDKFKTIMMMIQANDNQDLIKDAYEAAQQIQDEKTKSQALLDVINEINYFTQKKEN